MATDNINIAEILARQPRGTKLYSPICGDLFLDHIDDDEKLISCRPQHMPKIKSVWFSPDGRFMDANMVLPADGECLLFPSKALRQWDVTQFENGDIIVVKEYDIRYEKPLKYLMIFKKCDWRDGLIYFHALMMIGSDEWYGREGLSSVLINPQASKVMCLPACDCEVFEMNKALREHYLQWNAEKKCVEPLPNEEGQTATRFKFEPFDKVLVRDGDDKMWTCDLFVCIDEDATYVCISTYWNQCIPYNDDTKHLLGTCDPYKPKA